MLHISRRTNIVEPTTYKSAFDHQGDDWSMEATDGRTPLDDLLEKEEMPSADERDINAAKNEAVRRLLIYIFGETKDMLEALKKLALITYMLCPHLLADNSLDAIAKSFDSTRQCFSKRLLALNKEFHMRGRNQKSETAVEAYREHTTAWHEATNEDAEARAAKAKKDEERNRIRAEEMAYQKQLIEQAKLKAKAKRLARMEKEAEAKRKAEAREAERIAKQRKREAERAKEKLERAKKEQAARLAKEAEAKRIAAGKAALKQKEMKEKKLAQEKANRMAAKLREAEKQNKLPTRRIQTPEGKVVTFKNVTNFAQKHGLDASHLYKVFAGKIAHHKGYRIPTPKDSKPVEAMPVAIAKPVAALPVSIGTSPYSLLSPEGIVVTFNSVSKFAKGHGLDSSHLYKIFTKKQLSHKGYRLPERIEESK